MNVYWKDVRAAFLGANDAFLHYFNLSSWMISSVRSEEELGWNVEFDPTYREEEIALQIPVISEEKVHCMAKGMIRTVMMNKIPLIEGGRIVGSLSWFRDVTRFTQIQAELKKKSVIDALTGALNYQGFKETQSHFVDNYQKWDLDFILIYMDLDDFKHCNDAYGHGFGDMSFRKGSNVCRRSLTIMGSLPVWEAMSSLPPAYCWIRRHPPDQAGNPAVPQSAPVH